MNPSVFLFSLLVAVAFLNSKGLCRPSTENVQDYNADEAEDEDYNEDDQPYKGPPPVMLSTSGIVTAKVGDTVLLPCDTKNGNHFVLMWLNETTPTSTSTMWMDNTRLLGNNERINKTEKNALEIKNVTVGDAGVYVCKLSSTPVLNVTHKLVVAAPATKPTITKLNPSNEVSKRKGDALFLTCEALGNPEPKITWSKNDNKNNEARLQEDGTTLTIDSLTRKNSGIYTCTAENNIGSDSKSVTVHVHYAPEIEMEEDVIATTDEMSVNLICTVHATPRPKVTWLKNGEVLPTSQHMVNEKNKYTLHLPKVKPEDFGVYKCEASNKEGRSEESRTLSGKPKKPMLEITKDTKPQMIWKVESYAPISEYELMYKTQQELDWKTFRKDMENSDKNSYVYSIQHTFDSQIVPAHYETKLRVKNKYGWSDISDVHFFTKDEEGDISETSLLVDLNTTDVSEIEPTVKAKLGQQLYSIMSSNNVNEGILNDLAKSYNLPGQITTKGMNLLRTTFGQASAKFNVQDLIQKELSRVFMGLLNKDKLKEKLNMAKQSSAAVSNILSGASESSDRSSASELRISTMFIACLLVARLYC